MNADRMTTEKSHAAHIKAPLTFWQEFLLFALATAVIVVALEALLFNYQSWALLGKRCHQLSFSVSDLVLTDLEPTAAENEYRVTGSRPSIRLDMLHEQVETVHLDMQMQPDALGQRDDFNVSIRYADSTSATPRDSAKLMNILPTLKSSEYVTCSYFGLTDSLEFLPQAQPDTAFLISGITLNEPIPMNFSLWRVSVLFGTILLLYLLIRAPFFKQAYNNGRAQNIVLAVVAVVAVLTMVEVFSLYQPITRAGAIASAFTADSGDQLTQELVDAFEHGQLNLLTQPSPQLLAMDNPYDAAARVSNGVPFLWDHVLFNGQYYSYYGAVSTVLLFLPYHLLTGCYFPADFACLIFSVIGVTFLMMAFIRLIKNWFVKTRFGMVVCGLIILLAGCGVWFCLCRASFYEVAETSAFMLFAAGLYCLLRTGIAAGKPIRLRWLWPASLLLSLAVLCRATFVMYAIGALIWVIIGSRQYRRDDHAGTGSMIRYWVAAMLPFVVLAGIQMWYNAARFGSPFEFGVKYTLTTIDLTNTKFHVLLAFLSFWNFLFAAPNFRSDFPVMLGNPTIFGLNGYYFFETAAVTGLFWRALPLFSFAAVPAIKKRIPKQDFLRAVWLIGVPLVILPLIFIFTTWDSGHALRYNMDFASQMILAALVIVFFIYDRVKESVYRKVVYGGFILCAVLAVIANALLLFNNTPSDAQLAQEFAAFGRVLAFWQ